MTVQQPVRPPHPGGYPRIDGVPRPSVPRPPVWATGISRPPTWWRDTSVLAAWAVLLAVVALWVAGGGVQSLGTVDGALLSVGRLTGLIASALLLIQVFLMARVPWVERAWGQDALARTHRLVGFTSFSLMLAHLAIITLGYAAGSAAGLWGTIVDLTLNYPGMLLAIAGTVALCLVVVTSYRAARRRLRYESWHLIHLYAYLGVGLALPHQLWTGQEFLSSPVATVFWWGLYLACAGAVLVYRIGVPLWRSLRAPLRVVHVRPESPTTTTVVVGGPGVARLRAQAGQFFQWRFLDGPGWTRAHPFSLSAAPDGATLQFTAGRAGDGTVRLAGLRPGTRVLVEGPYGRLHPGVRTRRKVTLIGGGIGIAPMKSLLEGLPQAPGDVTVIHRVGSEQDPTLAAALDATARRRGARYVRLAGPRNRDRASWLPGWADAWDDAAALLHLCPDIAEQDVFVCGAPEWMDRVRTAALSAGVPADRIHLERFQY
ncbi:oxidoreductase [Tersicoccus solisilvae]|uniref:Oxidoreductase n=1 Tax=Tersicoccus solisilvae TaxID=1882339 RepID=A0ABQ1NTH2_9MICC|nr:ferric reductase-like transmembrane domain-containing protein [Tersicoccus solisilvae]GGC82371.1 oxidoreductase [Tersicoccus solisilvae]